jgi:hypothetical protein
MALEKKEWERKESLIRQAKAEWAKSHPSEQPKSSGGTFTLGCGEMQTRPKSRN